jgi:ribosomal protection tetracycline resistance protein
MDNLLLVDGYNVIFADKDLKELAEQDLAAAVQALIEQTQEFASLNELTPYVLLDSPNKTPEVQESELLGVKIFYGNSRLSADSLIEKISFDNKNAGITLVTSDRLLKDVITNRSIHNKVIESKAFAKLLKEEQNSSLNSAKSSAKMNLLQQLPTDLKTFFNNYRQGK